MGEPAPDADKVALHEICVAHGLDEAEVAAGACRVTSLDMFEVTHVEARHLRYFSALESVVMVHAPKVVSLRGIHSATLKQLFIIECNVRSLAGLETCVNLEILNLDGNAITTIDHLVHMRSLTSLWLNDNKLYSLDGVSACTSLQQLHVARNRITSLGQSLEGLNALTELNVSDNLLGSFDDVSALAKLPALTNLAFSDPHWGDNPVCHLCNYHTYVLFQLHGLKILDAAPVPEDAKAAAESTFVKKRMYYNMRTRTLRRNMAALLQVCDIAAGSVHSILASSLPPLEREAVALHTAALTYASRSLPLISAASHSSADDVEQGPSGDTAAAGAGADGEEAVAEDQALAELASLAKSKLFRVQSALRVRRAAQLLLQDASFALHAAARAALRSHLVRMELELYSGGNIRLEEGKPVPLDHIAAAIHAGGSVGNPETWSASVTAMMRSRAALNDFGPLQVRGVRVLRVVRVHNRTLRNRFERRIAALMAVQPPLATAIQVCTAAVNAQGAAAPSPTTARRLKAQAQALSPAALAAMTLDAVAGASACAAPVPMSAASAALAGKRGIEYVMYVPPWSSEAIRARLHEAEAPGTSAGAGSAPPPTASVKGAMPCEPPMSSVGPTWSHVWNLDAEDAEDDTALAGENPSTFRARAPAASEALQNEHVQRIIANGFGAADAVMCVPAPALHVDHFVAPPPTYAAPTATFGPAAKHSAAGASTAAPVLPLDFTPPTLLPAVSTSSSMAVPVSPTLASLDFARLSETIASALEASSSGEWSRDAPSASAARSRTNTSGSLRTTSAGGSSGARDGVRGSSRGAHREAPSASGVAEADAPSINEMRAAVALDVSKMKTPAVASRLQVSAWLRNAGLDVTRASTREALSTFVSELVEQGGGPTAVADHLGDASDGSGTDIASKARVGTLVRRGVVVISKMFSGNCLDASSGRTTLSFAPPDVQSSAATAAANGLLGKGAFSVHTVTAARADDARQRVYGVLDPALLLPEYVVEYEYLFAGDETPTDGSTLTESPLSGVPAPRTLMPQFSTSQLESLPSARDSPADALTSSDAELSSSERNGASRPASPLPFGERPRSSLSAESAFRSLFDLYRLLLSGQASATVLINRVRDLAAVAASSAQRLLTDLWLPQSGAALLTQAAVRTLPACPVHLCAQEESDVRPLIMLSSDWLRSMLAVVCRLSVTSLGAGSHALLASAACPPTPLRLPLLNPVYAGYLLSDADTLDLLRDMPRAANLQDSAFPLDAYSSAAGKPWWSRCLFAQERSALETRMQALSIDVGSDVDAVVEDDAEGASVQSAWESAQRNAGALALMRFGSSGSSLSTPNGMYCHPSAVPVLLTSPHASAIRELILVNCGLASLTQLELSAACPRLQVLDVSFNALTSLAGAHVLPTLRRLLASYNQIADLTDLAEAGRLPVLEELTLRYNHLSSVQPLLACAQRCPQLVRIDLRGNPVTCLLARTVCRMDFVAAAAALRPLELLAFEPAYFTLLVHCFPQCTVIDGRAVSAEDRQLVAHMVTSACLHADACNSLSMSRITLPRVRRLGRSQTNVQVFSVAPSAAEVELDDSLAAAAGAAAVDAGYVLAPELVPTVGAHHAPAFGTSPTQGSGAPRGSRPVAFRTNSFNDAGLRVGYHVLVPTSVSTPTSIVPSIMAQRAVQHMSAIARMADTRLAAEPRWQNVVVLDLTRAMLVGDSLFSTHAINAFASLCALKVLRLDANTLISLVAGAGSCALATPLVSDLGSSFVLSRDATAADATPASPVATPASTPTGVESPSTASIVPAPSTMTSEPVMTLDRLRLNSVAVLSSITALSLDNCNLLQLAIPIPQSFMRYALQARDNEEAGGSSSGGGTAAASVTSSSKRARPAPLLAWFSPLTALGRLHKLDLSHNHLTDEALAAARLHLLPHLTLLALEHNQLHTFAGFQGCRGLTELYLSNNHIGSTLNARRRRSVARQLRRSGSGGEREVVVGGSEESGHATNPLRILQMLRPEAFPRLIIADFSGNPFTQDAAYREYTIFYLRRLKVLDGAGVSAEESAAVRDRYSGKLTLDMLEERLVTGLMGGHDAAEVTLASGSRSGFLSSVTDAGSLSETTTMFLALKELDMASAKLREVELLPGHLFRSLTSVNLDHNAVSNEGLAGLRELPALQSLSLNHNKVTSIVAALGLEPPVSPTPPTGSALPATRLLGPSAQRHAMSSLAAATGAGPLSAPRRASAVTQPFAGLQFLYLAHNGICDMDALGLEYLTQLRVLNLASNEISRVSGLTRCAQLQSLNLESNSIRAVDADALSGCPALVELRLSDNSIKTLVLSDALTFLQCLHLSANRISDVADIDSALQLPALMELWLLNNPLARKHMYRNNILSRAPQLQLLDGKEVTGEERMRSDIMSPATQMPSTMGAAGSGLGLQLGTVPMQPSGMGAGNVSSGGGGNLTPLGSYYMPLSGAQPGAYSNAGMVPSSLHGMMVPMSVQPSMPSTGMSALPILISSVPGQSLASSQPPAPSLQYVAASASGHSTSGATSSIVFSSSAMPPSSNPLTLSVAGVGPAAASTMNAPAGQSSISYGYVAPAFPDRRTPAVAPLRVGGIGQAGGASMARYAMETTSAYLSSPTTAVAVSSIMSPAGMYSPSAALAGAPSLGLSVMGTGVSSSITGGAPGITARTTPNASAGPGGSFSGTGTGAGAGTAFPLMASGNSIASGASAPGGAPVTGLNVSSLRAGGGAVATMTAASMLTASRGGTRPAR